MKLIIVEAGISCLYIFDASTSPLLHIPLSYLTIIYLMSMLEVVGVFKFISGLKRRRGRATPAVSARARAAPLSTLLAGAMPRFLLPVRAA